MDSGAEKVLGGASHRLIRRQFDQWGHIEETTTKIVALCGYFRLEPLMSPTLFWMVCLFGLKLKQ